MLRSMLLSIIVAVPLFLSACNSSDYTSAPVKNDPAIKEVSVNTAVKGDTLPPAPSNTMAVKKDNAKQIMVGGDSDQHGCKASAGYTWSVVKNRCVRLFESGIKLDPKDAALNRSLVAYVVFKGTNSDSKAELFIPGKPGSIIFERTKEKGAAGTWLSGTMKLTQGKGMYTLEDGNKILYQGTAVRQ